MKSKKTFKERLVSAVKLYIAVIAGVSALLFMMAYADKDQGPATEQFD